MTFVKTPFALALAAVAGIALPGAAQLNPTVRTRPTAQTSVPPECADGTVPGAVVERTPIVPPVAVPEPAPQPQRPVARTLPPPPSNGIQPVGDVRTLLRRAQAAAEDDDYAGFKAALGDLRTAAAPYPAASPVMQVLRDVEHLWDYAMSSPTGAFLDPTDPAASPIVAMLQRYSGYDRAIAGQTLTMGGRTLYPTRESRMFLARESSRRLSQMGITTPTRSAGRERTPREITASPAPPVTRHTRTATTHRDETRPRTHTTTTTTHARTSHGTKSATAAHAPKPAPAPAPKPARREPVKIAEGPKKAPAITPAPAVTATHAPVTATPAPVTATHAPETATHAPVPAPPVTATHAPAPAPPVTATHAPAPAPPVTATHAPAPSTATVAPPQPPAPTPSTTTTVAPPPVTDTTVSTAATDTTVSTTDTTATTAPEAAPDRRGNVNLILAVILILVGIGVLVVLFRASD